MKCWPFRGVLSLALLLGVAAAGDAGAQSAELPSLLTFLDGSPVDSVDDWPHRRAEIHDLMIETFVGTFPTETPRTTSVQTLDEIQGDDGSLRYRLRLSFDTKNKASFEVHVWVPEGEGPFPILLVAPRSYQIDWAEAALTRGYVVCLYPGLDKHHPEKDFPEYESVWETFRAEYPDATWTEISCKGWLASRALDYLLGPTFEHPVSRDHIAIIGHSRYGKQAMIAAAFDERITAVVARSPGSPASTPYRLTSRHTFNEAPPDFPSPWFLEDLKGYVGREDELPIDAHAWAALIAPRPLMIHTAHQDGCEPTWAVERSFNAGQEVYALLGERRNYHLAYRSGSHNPITDEHRDQNMDWFDMAFGRIDANLERFPETYLHDFNWDAWKAQQPDEALVPPGADADTKDRVRWALGNAPHSSKLDLDAPYISEEDSLRMDHDRWAPEGVVRVPVVFGEGVQGNLYFKEGLTEPAPAVIWLHPYSYATGYNEAYGVQGTTIYHRLTQAGYVVLAFDQCGFGLRLLEGADFYDRNPEWSRMGRMVQDTKAGIDFLVAGTGKAQRETPAIRDNAVYLVGYSMGGMLGLYAAALDERIAGVASICGFTPMRSDTDIRATGGVRRLWLDHALLPKLGLYDGREREISYDYADLLTAIAPRPTLVVSPTRDRTANIEDVIACVARAQEQPGHAITHLMPDDVNRFQRDQQEYVLNWLEDCRELKGSGE